MTAARTWPNVEEMRRGIALMRQGCPYFAWQLPDGSYRSSRQIAQLERFEAGIFDGTHTPGFYSIRPDNLTRWGAIDFDAHGPAGSTPWRTLAESAFEILKGQFAEAWFLESSPGGFHVIAFAEALMPAADMRRILQPHAPEPVEYFPKQAELDTRRPNAKGSLLRFPGKHQLKGTWARFLASSGHVQDADGIAPAPKSSRWQEPSADGRLRSLYAVATRGTTITGTGQRYHAMQKIAGRLNGRANESESLWVYTAWHNHNADRIGTPLPEARKAFLACFHTFKPCNVEIPDTEPTPAQAAMIAALPKLPDIRPELLAATVRLFVAAKRYADTKGLPTFWLGYRTIGQRLGVGITAAAKYAHVCRTLGIVEMVERGHTGTATTYKLGRDWVR